MEQKTNQWYFFELKPEQAINFHKELNQCIIHNSDKVYFKLFTPKSKDQKMKIFYLADEGSQVVKAIDAKYNLLKCAAPDRKALTRVAGFSADREWMRLE